jgi:hypothetical protein
MGLFSKKKSRSAALITIDSTSVAGALANYVEHAPPTLHYSLRLPIEPKDHETQEEAMIRTLYKLTTTMVSNGAPQLRQGTGSGHVDHVLVSVGSPWQNTSVRMESVADTKPFTYSKGILSDALRGGPEIPDGYRKTGESVVATLLNGYEVPDPYGKRATRAEIMIVSSLIISSVASAVEETIRKTYHTHALTLTAFAPVASTVFATLYPHEHDFLIVQVSGGATDIAAIKHNLLADVQSINFGIDSFIAAVQEHPVPETGEASVNIIDPRRNERFSARVNEATEQWVAKMIELFQQFASRTTLPRTLFLLSDDESRDYLKRLLDNPRLRSLWLSDDSLRIIPVVPSHFSDLISVQGAAEIDVPLSLLTLYQGSLSLYP